MPSQSKGQKKTVRRVMHEYKKGELKSGQGSKVKKRKQAVAIALHEAGASNQASAQENKRNYSRTKRREQSGKTGTGKTGKTARSAAQKSSQARSTKNNGRSHASHASR